MNRDGLRIIDWIDGGVDRGSRILQDLGFASTAIPQQVPKQDYSFPAMTTQDRFHLQSSIEGFRILFSVIFLEQGDLDSSIRLFVFRR